MTSNQPTNKPAARDDAAVTDDAPPSAVPATEPVTSGLSLMETDVLEVANTMMDESVDAICMQVEQRVQRYPVEWRFHALRRMLVGLVQHLRDRSARLRILLQIVSTYTPQPLHLDGSDGREGLAVGVQLCGMIVGALDALCSPPPTPGMGEVLDFDWVTQEAEGLNKLAMLIMQFLECTRTCRRAFSCTRTTCECRREADDRSKRRQDEPGQGPGQGQGFPWR